MTRADTLYFVVVYLDCRDLIKKLLNPDPDRRITLEEIMKHPWIAEGRALGLCCEPVLYLYLMLCPYQ